MGREYVSVVDELKQELRSLESKRADLEKEILSYTEALPASVGMASPLVDREGFPRADVDVAQVRQLRQKIIMLKNDEKALNEELGKKLEQYFAMVQAVRSQTPSAASASSRPQQQHSNGASATPQDRVEQSPIPTEQPCAAQGRPFAIVEAVADSSPACEGALQIGDRLLRVGAVSSDIDTLGKYMQESEGQILLTDVLRRGAVVRLEIRPRQWAGRGLLGAFLRPL